MRFYEGTVETAPFKDISSNLYAAGAIAFAKERGIMNGDANGNFRASEYVTRAQSVTMMNRMFKRGPLHGMTTPSFSDVNAMHWAFKEIEEAAKSHSYVIDANDNEQFLK